MVPTHRKDSDESESHALAAHASNLQSRLLATLDALNELERYHQSELDELRVQLDRLRAKLRSSKQRAKAAEGERDRLREVVNTLAEKVEIAHDLRVLTPGRIRLSHPLGLFKLHVLLLSTNAHAAHLGEDPIPILIPQSPHMDPNSQRDGYFPAVVNHLTAKLTAERQAFAELKQTSEGQIAILKDQVARRDAELQRHILYPCTYHAPTTPRTLSHANTRFQSHIPTLTNEQVHETLDQTAVKNRALEVEIRGLAHKVEQTQISSSQRRKPTTSTPARRISPPSSHSAHLSPDPSAHVPQAIPPHKALSDIDWQLAGPRQVIEGLQTERHNLAATLDNDHIHDTDHGNAGEEFRGILLIEEECIRLRRSQRTLRQELLLSKATASATEQELKTLVERLQRQVDQLRNLETDGSQLLGEQDMDVEDDMPATKNQDAADQTARPLPFLLSTPPQRLSTPPHQPSPPSDFSPSWTRPIGEISIVDIPPTPLNRPPTAPPFRAQTTAVERLMRLESELNQAREDVEKKDRSIEALKAQLETLRSAVQLRGDGDG